MRGVSMLLLVGVVMCGPPPPQPCNVKAGGSSGFGGGTGGSGSGLQIGPTGTAMTVNLTHLRTFSCDVAPADEVVTEVLDPQNRKVEHTHTAPMMGDNFTTRISFTPTLAGNYHLSARFEPALGTSQTDVLVVVDRSSAPSKTLSLGVQCSALELTASGLALCLTTGDQLRVYRDDKLLQTLAADDFAAAGSVVWTTRLGVVERRVDVGGLAPLGNLLSFDTLTADVGTLLARENDAVLVTRGLTLELRVDAGVLVAVLRVTTAKGTQLIQPNLSFDRLLTFRPPETFTVGSWVCSAALATPSMTDNCLTRVSPSFALASDSSGIWSHDDRTLQLDAFGADGGIVTSSMLLPKVPTLEILRHFESGPIVRLGEKAYVPLATPEGIALEFYGVDPGFTLMPSSTRTVRAQHSDGRQKLFTR